MNAHTQTAELFKALAHPARVQIAEVLRGGEACVCHLEAHLRYRQPYISQQIMVLKKARLVAERREGTYVFYRMTDPRVVMLLDALKPVDEVGTKSRSSRRPACSCPHCTPQRATGL